MNPWMMALMMRPGRFGTPSVPDEGMSMTSDDLALFASDADAIGDGGRGPYPGPVAVERNMVPPSGPIDPAMVQFDVPPGMAPDGTRDIPAAPSAWEKAGFFQRPRPNYRAMTMPMPAQVQDLGSVEDFLRSRPMPRSVLNQMGR